MEHKKQIEDRKSGASRKSSKREFMKRKSATIRRKDKKGISSLEEIREYLNWGYLIFNRKTAKEINLF